MLIIGISCNCDTCKAMRKRDRLFLSKIIRIGRKYGVPNRKMLRPLAGYLNQETGEIEYARLPYEFE